MIDVDGTTGHFGSRVLTTRELRSLRTVTDQHQHDICVHPSLLILYDFHHFIPVYFFALLLPTLNTQHSSCARVPFSAINLFRRSSFSDMGPREMSYARELRSFWQGHEDESC